ncbi:unnamed protein product [Citrullus colocynthis]|uniref:Uncharacterized protein n=1 Tax=Citrullus colocynthis TaxID=252529 RepID=A0ABP0Y0Q1_9ROSI
MERLKVVQALLEKSTSSCMVRDLNGLIPLYHAVINGQIHVVDEAFQWPNYFSFVSPGIITGTNSNSVNNEKGSCESSSSRIEEECIEGSYTSPTPKNLITSFLKKLLQYKGGWVQALMLVATRIVTVAFQSALWQQDISFNSTVAVSHSFRSSDTLKTSVAGTAIMAYPTSDQKRSVPHVGVVHMLRVACFARPNECMPLAPSCTTKFSRVIGLLQKALSSSGHIGHTGMGVGLAAAYPTFQSRLEAWRAL